MFYVQKVIAYVGHRVASKDGLSLSLSLPERLLVFQADVVLYSCMHPSQHNLKGKITDSVWIL